MNKYTTLLQKYLKIMVFVSLVLSLFLGFGLLFRTSSQLENSALRDPESYKAAFFAAMQTQDLTGAREAVEKLATLVPPNDLFLTEVAPAYLADLYIKYAKSLQYNQPAYELMLAQAQKLSPEHPQLLVLKRHEQSETTAILEPEAPLAELAFDLEEQTIPVVINEPDLPAVIADGPPNIPYIDPPPLAGFYSEPERELIEELEDTPLSELAITTDPCALSYMTKNHALTPCIDAVGVNRFGPALFVVKNPSNEALLAFTQQAITRQEYQLFCDATGQCYEELEDEKPLIDLSDVEETVHDYNAYCQMSGSCEKISSKPSQSVKPLTRGQAQRYALWLSQTTGHKYRHPKQEDAAAIQGYFKACVQTKDCSPEILQTVAGLMEQSDRVLVREVE